MKRNTINGFFILMIIILQTFRSYGQIRELKIGEQVPEITFSEAYNFKTHKNVPFKLSNLKGKLVILDFWGTYCEPCLEGFPLLDSFQKKYKNKIQFITVNPQSKKTITDFLKIHTAVYIPDIPFVTSDTILSKLFPHIGSPFQVWISPSGEVLHQAEDYNLTARNIDSVLSGNDIKIREGAKKVFTATLFDSRWSGQVIFSSYLFHHHQDNGLRLEEPEVGKGFSDEGTIVDLYQRAYDSLTYGKYEFTRPYRTIVELKDTTRFINTERGEKHIEWADKNEYLYQITVPEDYPGSIWEMMKQDLDRYFRINTSIERRMVESLVLVRTSKMDKLKTKGGVPIDNFRHAEKRNVPLGPVRNINNEPFSVFERRLGDITEYSLHHHFEDSTDYKGNIDIQMPAKIFDDINLASLRKELNKYDLDLVEKMCPLDVLVLQDSK